MGRNFWSLLSLLTLVVGTFCYVMLIFNDQKIVENLQYTEYYKAGAAVGTALTVFFLVYLTATTSQKTTGVKTVILTILVIGLIVEAVLMMLPIEDENVDYAKYGIITFNFLYRTYYILSYIQEPWAEITFDTINTGIKAVTPSAVAPSSGPKGDDVGKAFKDKWVEIRGQARAKYGAENLSEGEANSIINKAIFAGDLNKSKYSEALAALKTKSGEAVAGISVGGRRKHR